MKHSFPDNYGDECIIVAFDKSLLPMIAGALRPFEKRYSWVTEEDYEQGYNAFAQVQADMANNCLQELIESNNRLYRLLDSVFNGTEYSATGGESPVVTPAIPAAPPAEIGAAPGLRRQLLDAQGELPAGFMGLFPRPATTTDMVQALRQGSEAEGENLLSKLDLLGDASDIGSLFNVVRTTITDGLEVGAEGGILAVLVASTMANAAMMGLQAGQLDTLNAHLARLVASTDGGAEPRPDSNVLAELAGVNEKLT